MPEMGRLHDAAEKGDVAAVRRLIAEKCNVNERGDEVEVMFFGLRFFGTFPGSGV